VDLEQNLECNATRAQIIEQIGKFILKKKKKQNEDARKILGGLIRSWFTKNFSTQVSRQQISNYDIHIIGTNLNFTHDLKT